MTESIPDSTKDMRKGSFGLPPGWLPRNKPEDVAPMIAWLSSDEASEVTGQIFHCVGNSVSLMNTPKSTRVINKDGRWSVEEISGIFEETLGMDLINPSPPND
jgi:NAD(P)-dependent dehydrogenase (short-subunit alcohol dehydrogenase family)